MNGITRYDTPPNHPSPSFMHSSVETLLLLIEVGILKYLDELNKNGTLVNKALSADAIDNVESIRERLKYMREIIHQEAVRVIKLGIENETQKIQNPHENNMEQKISKLSERVMQAKEELNISEEIECFVDEIKSIISCFPRSNTQSFFMDNLENKIGNYKKLGRPVQGQVPSFLKEGKKERTFELRNSPINLESLWHKKIGNDEIRPASEMPSQRPGEESFDDNEFEKDGEKEEEPKK